MFGSISWYYIQFENKGVAFTIDAGLKISETWSRNFINPLGEFIEPPVGLFRLDAFNLVLEVSTIYLMLKDLVLDFENSLVKIVEFNTRAFLEQGKITQEQATAVCQTDNTFGLEMSLENPKMIITGLYEKRT